MFTLKFTKKLQLSKILINCSSNFVFLLVISNQKRINFSKNVNFLFKLIWSFEVNKKT